VKRVDVAIIGGGQAGLAMSYCLSARGIEHVVLERGRVGERWRSERWDSLHLLTPNWLARLPGYRYSGDTPDGYMSRREVIAYLEDYAATFAPPLETGVAVERVTRAADGYAVTTSADTWRARAVVVATGYCDRPAIPGFAARLRADVRQIAPAAYRNADQLPDGAVLIVGASATGVQLADEIQTSGRPVILAAGRHLRMPRRYRGFDILWWMDRMGLLDERVDNVFNADISRRQPSMQLVGRSDPPALGLRELHARGVRVVGRVRAIDGAVVRLDDDLVATTAAADIKLAALLARIDEHIGTAGLSRVAGEPEPFTPSWPLFAGAAPPERVDLNAEGVRTIVWATGFARDYSWLAVPVRDAQGELVHEGGITPAPGLVALGLPFQRKRNSAFIDGVGADAGVLAAHLSGYLSRPHTAGPPPVGNLAVSMTRTTDRATEKETV
jgi:putative flavoprotein involved in K+ transport